MFNGFGIVSYVLIMIIFKEACKRLLLGWFCNPS